jgi:ATP synthase protein I
MTGQQPPPDPRDPHDASVAASQGWTAVAYLISGIAVWGFFGWLVDRWLGSGGIATAIGAILGAGLGVYLIVRRLGA